MGSVVQLAAARRSPGPSTGDLLVCECGGTWFELCSYAADGTKYPGLVVLNIEGSVTGYAGTPHCGECGREKLP